MTVRESEWEKVRTQFTESEKEHLRMNMAGETICPRGWVVNENELPKELKIKLLRVLKRTSPLTNRSEIL